MLTGFVAERYQTVGSSNPETWSTPIVGYASTKGSGCLLAVRRSGNSLKETSSTSR